MVNPVPAVPVYRPSYRFGVFSLSTQLFCSYLCCIAVGALSAVTALNAMALLPKGMPFGLGNLGFRGAASWAVFAALVALATLMVVSCIVMSVKMNRNLKSVSRELLPADMDLSGDDDGNGDRSAGSVAENDRDLFRAHLDDMTRALRKSNIATTVVCSLLICGTATASLIGVNMMLQAKEMDGLFALNRSGSCGILAAICVVMLTSIVVAAYFQHKAMGEEYRSKSGEISAYRLPGIKAAEKAAEHSAAVSSVMPLAAQSTAWLPSSAVSFTLVGVASIVGFITSVDANGKRTQDGIGQQFLGNV